MVTSLFAASTGTAISTLSGDTAHGVMLTWFGGGTLASAGTFKELADAGQMQQSLASGTEWDI